MSLKKLKRVKSTLKRVEEKENTRFERQKLSQERRTLLGVYLQGLFLLFFVDAREVFSVLL